MNKQKYFISLILFCVIVAGCASPSIGEPSPKEEVVDESIDASQAIQSASIETNITIDGDPLDWEGYEVLFTDPEGDHQDGGFDIAAIRAFSNDKFLYVLIETHQPPTDYVQVDITASAGERDYILSFRPQAFSTAFMGDVTGGQFEAIGEVAGSESAAAEAVECKMPLSAFEDASNLKLGVRAMGGTCCESPDWYAIDEIGQTSVVKMDEIEPKQDLTTPSQSPGSKLIIEQTQVDLSEIRGDEPTDLVMSTDGKRIYTVGRNTDTLFVIDGANNQITNIIEIKGVNNKPYGSRPDKLALTKDDNKLLIANFNDGSVSIFDTNSLKITQTVSTMPELCDVAVSQDGNVFAVSRCEARIAIFNLYDVSNVDFINIPIPAFSLAVSPDGKTIYAASAKGIYVVDSNSKQIVRQITLPIEGHMGNILLNSSGSTAFLSMRDTNQVLQIDLAEGKVLQSYSVNAAAEGLALNANEDKLFVGTFTALSEFEYTVAVIDLIKRIVTDTIMPLSPAEHVSWIPVVEGLAVKPDGHVYFATEDADAVFIADGESFEHIATIPLTDFARLQPVRLSISTDGKWLFTANAAPQVASISISSTSDQGTKIYYYDSNENSSCIASASGVDISSDSGLAYVSAGNCLLTFDPSQESFIGELQLEVPSNFHLTDLKIDPDGNSAYLLDNGGGLIRVDLSTMTPSDRLQVLGDAYNLKIDYKGKWIYITGSSDFAIVETETFQVIKSGNASFIENKQFSKYPNRLIGIDPKERFYLIGDFNSFSIFDPCGHQRLRGFNLDQWAPHRQLATDAVFKPDGSTGYLALWDMKGIVAFDPDTWQVLAQIDTGSAPYYVVCPDDFAISPDGSRLYVTGEQSDNILIIDTETNQAIDVIQLVP